MRQRIWLTRRGLATVILVVFATYVGWQHGARALNAVAAPAAVALVVGLVSVWRASYSDVDISPLRPGFPGESRQLSVAVDGRGLATVDIDLPGGLADDRIEATVTLPHTFERSTELTDRGVYDRVEATVRLRDPLGLFERRFDSESGTELVVYPRRYSLGLDLDSGVFLEAFAAERQEFDRLREYVPSDPLRNVHWKTSAKHDEFYVVEYSESRSRETIHIAASAARGMADEMASAVVSVAETALDSGFDVAVAVPDGSVPAGSGAPHRGNVLRLLARTGAGSVPAEVVEADIVIEAGSRTLRNAPRETTIRIGSRSSLFEDLQTGPYTGVGHSRPSERRAVDGQKEVVT